MKKHYSILTLLLIILIMVCQNVEAGTPQNVDPAKTNADLLRDSGPLNPPSILVAGADVVMKPTTVNQTDVKIATAFNGWMYSVFNSHDGVNDSIFVMHSRNHGISWNKLISAAGYNYSSDIIVCGNDTNALDLYVSSILYDATTGMHTFWVNKNNALTGALIDVPITESSMDTIYDGALAHDFQHPAAGASPYSVEAVYSKHGASEDSVIAILSMDGGATFTDRKVVDINSDQFGKVAVCYGYSPDDANGKYFVAYEQHLVGAKYGHIKVSRTDAQVSDPFTTPIYVDSLFTIVAQWANFGNNPSISVQNSATSNSSNGLTAVVMWESFYNGTPDYDCVGAFSLMAGASSGTWQHCYVDYAITDTYQPDICFDETNNKFLVTYWDSTNNRLRYYSQGFNMPTPIAWTLGTLQYNDRVGTMLNPYPQIAFDPHFGTADFVWNEIRSSVRTALFDAEFSVVGIQDNSLQKSSSLHHYPNPANDYTNIRFYLEKSQPVSLEIYDVVGKRIGLIDQQIMASGSHQLKIDVSQWPAGYYSVSYKTNDEQSNQKLLIIH